MKVPTAPFSFPMSVAPALSPSLLSQTHQDLWRRIIARTSEKIQKTHCVTWFKDTAILSFEGGTLVVGTPNPMSAQWISSHYQTILLDAAQAEAPSVQSIAYEVVLQLADPNDPRKLSLPELQTLLDTKSPRKLPRSHEIKIGKTLRSNLLAPKYTLENFVVGANNRLAHAACQAVTRKPGSAYNPLFIYGGVGLGKTHLLQAIGNAILRTFPDQTIVYLPSERLINEIVASMRNYTMSDFRQTYRNVDCLIVDDVQFFAHKERTQEIFFHLFNDRYDAGKQIVLSSDRPPKSLEDLEDRLRSRFEMGMIVDVQFPEFETRLAILQTKCQEQQIFIDQEVLEFIAYNVHHSVRELEGMVLQLVIHIQQEKVTPTIPLVAKLLQKQNPAGQLVGFRENGAPRLTIAKTADDIIGMVADYFHLMKSDIVGEGRKKEMIVPRRIAMYLVREGLGYSYKRIGQEFGNRNHTTVLHACDKLQDALKRDERLLRDLNALRREIGCTHG